VIRCHSYLIDDSLPLGPHSDRTIETQVRIALQCQPLFENRQHLRGLGEQQHLALPLAPHWKQALEHLQLATRSHNLVAELLRTFGTDALQISRGNRCDRVILGGQCQLGKLCIAFLLALVLLSTDAQQQARVIGKLL
jgi:hypothetical protein